MSDTEANIPEGGPTLPEMAEDTPVASQETPAMEDVENSTETSETVDAEETATAEETGKDEAVTESYLHDSENGETTEQSVETMNPQSEIAQAASTTESSDHVNEAVAVLSIEVPHSRSNVPSDLSLQQGKNASNSFLEIAVQVSGSDGQLAPIDLDVVGT